MKAVRQTSKYQLIKAELSAEIINGTFSPGEKFYSESELRMRYGVSASTVVRAIHEMVNEGYLIRYQGKGTFISKAKRNEGVMYSESDRELKGIQSVKLISCEISTGGEIAEKLGLTQNESYYSIIRLKFDNHHAYALQISYIPTCWFSGDLTVKGAELVGSVYEALKRHSGLDMYAMPYRQTLYALNTMPAAVRQWLAPAEAPQPVILIQRHTWNKQGGVLEYIETYKRLESFFIEIKTAAKGSE